MKECLRVNCSISLKARRALKQRQGLSTAASFRRLLSLHPDARLRHFAVTEMSSFR